jgi:hypothetical protein
MKQYIGLVLSRPLILLFLSECLAWSQTKQEHTLIIDMHLYAPKVAEFGAGSGPTPRMCSTNEGTIWSAGIRGRHSRWKTQAPAQAPWLLEPAQTTT